MKPASARESVPSTMRATTHTHENAGIACSSNDCTHTHTHSWGGELGDGGDGCRGLRRRGMSIEEANGSYHSRPERRLSNTCAHDSIWPVGRDNGNFITGMMAAQGCMASSECRQEHGTCAQKHKSHLRCQRPRLSQTCKNGSAPTSQI
jgi:hypothetical protein